MCAVGAVFLNLAAKAVIGPVGRQAIGTGQRNRIAETGVKGTGFFMAQGIAAGYRKAALWVIRRATAACGDVHSADGRRHAVAEGIQGISGGQFQAGVVWLDNFLRQQTAGRVVGKSRGAGRRGSCG